MTEINVDQLVKVSFYVMFELYYMYIQVLKVVVNSAKFCVTYFKNFLTGPFFHRLHEKERKKFIKEKEKEERKLRGQGLLQEMESLIGPKSKVGKRHISSSMSH